MKSKFFDIFLKFFYFDFGIRQMIAEEENKRGGQATDVISAVSSCLIIFLDYFLMLDIARGCWNKLKKMQKRKQKL